jgi:hypothetical protein
VENSGGSHPQEQNTRSGDQEEFFSKKTKVSPELLTSCKSFWGRLSPLFPHCTLAVTAALAFRVNVQVRRLSPPLEHAPDQIASRPFETLRVMDVPDPKDAEPVLPTLTEMPAGLEMTRSPLRPVADTVNVNVDEGGGGVPPCGVKLRTEDQAPRVPAEFTPRTRQK